jgi:hypothetical protein
MSFANDNETPWGVAEGLPQRTLLEPQEMQRVVIEVVTSP